MTNAMPVYQAHFVKQLKFHHISHRDDKSILLLTLSHILTKTSDSGMKTVKYARDLIAAESLTTFTECDIPNIKKKEKLFDQYLDVLDEVYKICNNKPADSDLSALNEFWGLWLLINFKESDPVEDLSNKLTKDLKTARKKLKNRESPSSNLHHYTAFGNELRKKGDLAESIKMYTKAIEEDHCWAAISYYNRAFAHLSQKDRHQDPNCIDQALEDLQHALKSVELYCEQIEATQRYSKQAKDLCSESITRFDKHMTARHNVLSVLKENINEAIRKVDRARDLGRYVKVVESLVYFLVPVMHFLPQLSVLSTESVTQLFSRDPLRIYQLITDPSFDIVNELRCLESLGLTHVYALDTLFSLGGFFSKIHRIIRRALD